MSFFIINLFILVIILVLLLLLSWVWPPDSPWSPWWKTTAAVAHVVVRLAKLTNKDIIFELGCGDAEHLIVFAKKYKIRCVGVEIDPLRYLIAKWNVRRNRLDKKITIRKGNLYDCDISTATVIYVYLLPRVLKKLLPIFKKQLKPGTKIISYRYKIEGLKQIGFDEKNIIYVYKVSR
jgi:predicted RNA methylase